MKDRGKELLNWHSDDTRVGSVMHIHRKTQSSPSSELNKGMHSKAPEDGILKNRTKINKETYK